MALGIMEESQPYEKWVVITPRPIIKTAWVEDNQTFFPNMMLLPISRNMNLQDYEELAEFYHIRMPFRLNAERAKEHLKQYAKGFIINPESFKIDLDKVIRKLGITGMIVDESSIMKDATTDTAKAILSFGEEVKRAYPMSGKPAPNDELEYFSQMQLIDKSIFGTRYTKFRDLYAMPHPAGFGYRVTPLGAMEIAQRIAPWCIFISKEECLDLPERTFRVHEVALSTEAKRHYVTMLRELAVYLDNKEVSVQTKLTAAMKLRQITSGFILNKELDESAGALVTTMEHLHNDKLNELANVIDSIPNDQQVIIWINFHAEVDLISEMLRKRYKEEPLTAYGKTGARKLDENIATFKAGNARFLIAHPKSIKYGITFVKCSYAVWYSLSPSFEDYYQANDRIYRKGQVNKCSYILLLCPKTIDTQYYALLGDKDAGTRLVEDIAKEAREA